MTPDKIRLQLVINGHAADLLVASYKTLLEVLREDLGCDELDWERGKAWAFEQAMGLVWYYAKSNPAMSRMGRRTLERIQADTWPTCA